MVTTKYENLTPWVYPDSYGGQTWYGWFAVYGQSRDSDALEKSNYRRILEDLKALDTELLKADIDPRQGDYDSPGDSTVCDTLCNHWACGWVETIYVHSSNEAACKLADEIVGGLQDYCVYDESDFSALEIEEQDETWENTLRSDFSRALGKALVSAYEDSPVSKQREGESEADYDKRYDAAVDWLEGGADIATEGIDELARELQDVTNTYWEEGWLNVDRLIKGLPKVKALLKDLMGDAKYDHGIYTYVDPNQLNLELA